MKTQNMTSGNAVSKNLFLAFLYSRTILFAVVAYIIVFKIFAVSIIPSGSMIPTLQLGDCAISVRISDSTKLNRGDIATFYPRGNIEDLTNGDLEKSDIYIKRLIGLPGDTVEIKNNTLYINGEAVDEPYVAENTVMQDFGPISVPEGEYFLMGDNRNYSYDCRFIGSIARQDMIEKELFSFTPISKLIKQANI